VLAVTSLPRRTTQAVLLLVLSVLVGASFAPGLASAQASRVTITLTAEGPQPAVVEVPQGGTVVFVNDDTEQHRITSTDGEGSTSWELDRTLAAKDGEMRSSTETPAFGAAGRYYFSDARGVLGLGPSRKGEIKVSPPLGASDGAGCAGGAPPAPGSPPPATGGTGRTGPLPLTGGFGSFGTTPQAIPGLDPLAPAIAPPLALPPGTPLVPGSPVPTPGLSAPQIAAPALPLPLPIGSLPGVATDRSYGLPAALALVSIVGVVSLLVRALLAEPAARRQPALPPRPVTVTVAT
jgi:plastocyanin